MNEDSTILYLDALQGLLDQVRDGTPVDGDELAVCEDALNALQAILAQAQRDLDTLDTAAEINHAMWRKAQDALDRLAASTP